MTEEFVESSLKIYLKEMNEYKMLTQEEEINFAKRIE
jgi:DNA-directed RNA polymerase sigma subunit (sigma70/sigma32)